MYKLCTTLLVLFAMSCKTTPEKAKELNTKITSNNASYNYKLIQTTSINKYRPSTKCTGKLDANWKKLVLAANSCIIKKNNSQLLKISNKLSLDFPNSPWGNYFKSVYFNNNGLHLKALWLIDNVIKNYNHVGAFHHLKSNILYKLNYLIAAKEEAQKAISLDESNYGALLFLAQIELAATNNGKAIEYAQQALKIHSTNELYLLLGEAYFADKKYKKALPALKRANSSQSHIYFKIAYSYEQLGMLKEALTIYKKVPQLKRSEYSQNYNINLNEKIKDFEAELSKSNNRMPSKNKESK